MSANFPIAPGSTSNNSEREGHRGGLEVSDFVRSLPDVRTLDLDQYGYCPCCKRRLWFLELTSRPHKVWDMTKLFARDYKGYGCVVYYQDGDTAHEHPISFHHVGPGYYHSPRWEDDTSWARLHEFLDGVREAHGCKRTTARNGR